MSSILHIDGDAFFASCEQARNPALRGKPVITGKERGIAASMSYEAKARGVTRAMRLFEIKKLCPDAIILPSDYETYSILSERFYKIVRRYTEEVEEYGIDECFADVTGCRRPASPPLGPLRCDGGEGENPLHRSGGGRGRIGNRYDDPTAIALAIQEDLRRELGFTFSIGLAPTKVLAKLGSKWKKPYGLTVIKPEEIFSYLDNYAAEKVWGIGPKTTLKLASLGIKTSGEFARQTKSWVKHYFSKPILEIWDELNGRMVLPLSVGAHGCAPLQSGDTVGNADLRSLQRAPQSIQKFKTFTPPSSDPKFIFAQLSKNIENACIKLRRYNLTAPGAVFILRTQQFDHRVLEVEFVRPTNLPPEMLPVAREAFKKMFHLRTDYRATGVALFNLVPYSLQGDLFNSTDRIKKLQNLYSGADKIAKKYGKHTLFLGTSWKAHQFGAHQGDRGDDPARKNNLFKGETKRKRLNIPMLMGEILN